MHYDDTALLRRKMTKRKLSPGFPSLSLVVPNFLFGTQFDLQVMLNIFEPVLLLLHLFMLRADFIHSANFGDS